MPKAPPAAAPPPAATPPAPSPAPDLAVDLAGSDAFAALEALTSDDGAPDPQPGDKPAGGTPKDPDTGKFVPKDKPKVKPAASAAPKPTDAPGSTKELKEHYERLKAEKAEIENKYKTERTTWEQQLAEAKKGDPQVAERMTKLQKDWEEAQNELKFVRYESSADFKERFEKPYISAYQAGMNRAAALKVIERKDEGDPTSATVLQQARQGKPEDFDAIMSFADDDLAAERASELFGDKKAALVLYHREEVMKANGAMRAAIKEYREKGTQWEKERSEQMNNHKTAAMQMVEQMQAAAAEKFPSYFKPIENDTKGNEMLDKGNHMVKRIIANGAPLAEGETQWTHQEYASHVAAFRNKAGGFDRIALQNVQLRKQVKEMQEKLKAYEESEPGDGEGRRETAAAGGAEDDPFKQLDAMAVEQT
jgi:hypothetical protein